MYLATKDGIKEVPKLRRFKSKFCGHTHFIEGDSCSKNGMRRISGRDHFVVCTDCGKILYEAHGGQ